MGNVQSVATDTVDKPAEDSGADETGGSVVEVLTFGAEAGGIPLRRLRTPISFSSFGGVARARELRRRTVSISISFKPSAGLFF